MKCAYCGNETKGTKEHIISCGILDLFPECNITFDLTRNIVHEADPMVKDVCSNCNSNLSYLDSYARDMVKAYGLTDYNKDDLIEFKYDYGKLQKLFLKFAYNDMRSYKYDCSYFDEDIVNFIMDDTDNNFKEYVSVFAGLAVNTSPMPAAFTGNQKIQWGKDPILYSNSMIKFIDYNTGHVYTDENPETNNFEDLVFSYIFRFNSIQFILLCWDKTSLKNDTNRTLFGLQYPYEMLTDKGISTLKICTNETNYHNIMMVNVKWDLITEVESMRKLSRNDMYSFRENFDKLWKQEEKNIANSAPREREKKRKRKK